MPQRHGHLAVRRARGEQVAQRAGPAQAVEPRHRAPGLGALVGRDLALEVEPERGEAGRPHRAGPDLHAGPVHVGARGGHGLRVRHGGQGDAVAPVAPAAGPPVGQLGVVELGAQVRHPAPGGGHVVDHRLLLRLAGGLHPRVPLGVVRPRGAGGDPAALHAADRAVDVEHLEHRLEPGPLEVDLRLQRGGGLRALGGPEGAERGADLRLRGERLRPEPVPDRPVLVPGQQHDDGVVHATAGAAHLLVVGDGGGRGAEVHDEREVGLVEAHAERGRRDQGLDPVLLEVLLELLPLGGVGAPGVGGDREARAPELLGHLLGRGHGEAVDDARPLDVLQRLDEPRHPRGLVGELEHGEVQRLAVQPAPQHEHVLVGGGVAAGRGAVHAELLGDVGGDAGVGGGRRGEDGDARRQVGEQGADAAVVGPEVVAPVGDAVRLVDHHEAGVGRQAGEHLVAERRVVEPLGRAEQHVDLARRDRRVHLVPLGDVRRVDRHGADPGARRGRDLVPHERQERRHDDGGPGAAGAQQRRGDEVDGGLAPPGALHDERATPERDEGLDRAPLVLAQRRVLAADQRAQRLLGLLAQRSAALARAVEQAAEHRELRPLGGVGCRRARRGLRGAGRRRGGPRPGRGAVLGLGRLVVGRRDVLVRRVEHEVGVRVVGVAHVIDRRGRRRRFRPVLHRRQRTGLQRTYSRRSATADATTATTSAAAATISVVPANVSLTP